MNVLNMLKSEVENDKDIKIYKMIKNEIIFENRVLINCFYCSKYNSQWTCPPKIPNIDYKKVINEYDNIIIVGKTYDVNETNYSDIRNKSTNEIHSMLLKFENLLWDKNYPMAISFIGGSCKLCKNGCAIDKCKNPSKARIPIEATGINVIKTLKNINIDIDFSDKTKLSRYGMLLW